MTRTLHHTLNQWSVRTLDRLWAIERRSPQLGNILFRVAIFTFLRTNGKEGPRPRRSARQGPSNMQVQ